jgi:hypothetical protein
VFDFHEKRKIKGWLFSKSAIAALVVASLALASSVYGLYRKEREMAQKHAERLVELERLEHHASALEAEVAYAESARGIEEEIRDRFDVVKKGERAVIVMDEVEPKEAAASTTPAPLSPPEPEQSFFSRLFSWW